MLHIVQNFDSTLLKLSKINPRTKLLCVTKRQEISEILPLIHKNHTLFGENYIQEAESKWVDLKNEYPHIKLHMIGKLQSNKVKNAIQLFDAIETVDSLRLYELCLNEISKTGRDVKLFFQINISNEEQKSGFELSEFHKVMQSCRKPDGIMCIPSANRSNSFHFLLMSKIAQEYGINQVSMGMSSDCALAARLGSTEVRIGSAIFCQSKT